MEMVTMKLRLLLLLITATSVISSPPIKEIYIVRMDKSQMPTAFNHQFQWYDSILHSVTPSSPELLYKFDTVLDGFSVPLTSNEAESLENLPGVLSVMPDRKYELHTTRTPEFLGLINRSRPGPQTPFKNASEVIVGLLDGGIWPEHKSFDNSGLGPVPSGWKGSCDEGDYFNASSSCNRKLIGARYFYKGVERIIGPLKLKSARDYDGHGTHTSSTAAGSLVQNASLFGLASGLARGMAPEARIAAYKVCWGDRCILSDVLAGMEKAIEDGVHVMSLSIGGAATNYYEDGIAVGAFAAMSKGIFVSCSAGNSGPESGFVTNIAPWITTVGAGTLDREFPTNVTLGNGKVYTGVSLYNEKPFMESPAPLVYGRDCYSPGEEVKGKVVLCDDYAPVPTSFLSKLVKEAGGISVIIVTTEGEEPSASAFFLSSAAVGKKAGDAIRNYTMSDPNPTAIISPVTTELGGVQPSPMVVGFSSRGPNQINPEILKPDIIAPGSSILAAWTAAAGPTDLESDNRNVTFNIMSGTSMSCPHISGIAVLLKATHPDWSPAAIRSALMTTAYTVYQNGKPILDRATERPATPFDYGSGHVDPTAANDPGLVYDLSEEDYLGFLCALNYTPSQIKSVTNIQNFTCDPSKEYSLADFNYPSFAVVLDTSSSSTTAKYTRTVTNVASSSSTLSTTYTVSVSFENPSVEVTVEPTTLTFSESNAKRSYTVTFETSSSSSWEAAGTTFGSLTWSDLDGKHKVRSPIALTQNGTNKKKIPRV